MEANSQFSSHHVPVLTAIGLSVVLLSNAMLSLKKANVQLIIIIIFIHVFRSDFYYCY